MLQNFASEMGQMEWKYFHESKCTNRDWAGRRFLFVCRRRFILKAEMHWPLVCFAWSVYQMDLKLRWIILNSRNIDIIEMFVEWNLCYIQQIAAYPIHTNQYALILCTNGRALLATIKQN